MGRGGAGGAAEGGAVGGCGVTGRVRVLRERERERWRWTDNNQIQCGLLQH